MRPSGSLNTVFASSNATLCFARLAAAFGPYHSNLRCSGNYRGSRLLDAYNAPDQPPQRGARAAVGCIRKFDARKPGSQQRGEIIAIDLGIPENRYQETGSDGLTAVDWHNGSSAIGCRRK